MPGAVNSIFFKLRRTPSGIPARQLYAYKKLDAEQLLPLGVL
jgi:hypothetical protein